MPPLVPSHGEIPDWERTPARSGMNQVKAKSARAKLTEAEPIQPRRPLLVVSDLWEQTVRPIQGGPRDAGSHEARVRNGGTDVMAGTAVPVCLPGDVGDQLFQHLGLLVAPLIGVKVPLTFLLEKR